MNNNGLISSQDYHQVFEEVVMSITESLVKHANKADIGDLRKMVCKWIDYYSKKEQTNETR